MASHLLSTLRVAVILMVLNDVLLEVLLLKETVISIKPSPSVIRRGRVMWMKKFGLLRVRIDLVMEE